MNLPVYVQEGSPTNLLITTSIHRYPKQVLTVRARGLENSNVQGRCSNNDCKRQSDSDGGDLEGELIELVDIVLEITEEALGSNYSGTGSGTFVGGNFLSPTIVIDPNYQGP
ncbi:uncharacterized protein PG986_008034 [Apiospora aurea]|uniref:Uncharacterized protein n=1 Tax=Apiospora aurea TaxID=335848 RepID=A0ABR1QF14_9PEZI